MTDPRVEILAAHLMTKDFSSNDGGRSARSFAKLEIVEIEAAGLIVLADNDQLVERVCEALDCYQYDTFNAARLAVGLSGFTDWADLSDRTRRIRHDQFIDTARAVVAALRLSPPADFPERSAE